MVQALQVGRKTQTRRVVKPQPKYADQIDPAGTESFFHPGEKDGWRPSKVWTFGEREGTNGGGGRVVQHIKCPYGQPGDILWVRETWAAYGAFGVDGRKEYKADTGNANTSCWLHWKPSIHMPKEAARLFLQVVSVRAERLQSITEEDAKAEGVQSNKCDPETEKKCPSYLCKNGCCCSGEYYRYPINFDAEPAYSAKESFESLWVSINGSESWETNPWVWAVEFKKIDKPANFLS